jgi:hypothetical protein
MNGIVKIHNKEYKTVALRVTEFLASTKHKDWSIETDLISDGNLVVMKSTIKDESGRVRGTGHAEELRGSTNINKTSAMENAETSCIGRALSAVGFGGTEYASANEVTDAIILQTEINAQEQLLTYNASAREHLGTIAAIKDALACDDFETASEEWLTLNEEQQRSIWRAPSKGGMFTTKELATMKTSEFREAGIAVSEAI